MIWRFWAAVMLIIAVCGDPSLFWQRFAIALALVALSISHAIEWRRR